ncbi:MAG: 16S rRNA (adenine(1518)-N(6)/adenine(1519)-N(6))-dimethyltransferase [Deltaproteobacteria bacterium]|nr:16S rRNA (adenine(1518)-N(6)/adenine(1519)-N(6))-dimethyltransferase [Deltaproteobacteria bacterium]
MPVDVKATLQKYKLSASQKFSQNFLKDEHLAERIVKAARITSTDVVLEIGTGLGILTKALAKNATKVMTFEKDKKLLVQLPFILQTETQIEVIPQDFLTYDLSLLQKRFKKIKVAANLPFHISTDVLFHLFEYRDWIESMTLMFQKEVAERIVASPGIKAYGILSVLSQLYSTPKILVKIVKAGFGQRRKILLNSLRKLIAPQILTKVMTSLGMDVKRRMEIFSLEEIKKLTEALYLESGDSEGPKSL